MKRATIPYGVPTVRLPNNLLGHGCRLATHTAAGVPHSFTQLAELVRRRCRLRIRPDGSVEVAIIVFKPGTLHKNHPISNDGHRKAGKPT